MKMRKVLKFLVPLAAVSALAVALPVALTSCSSDFTNYKVNHEEFNSAIKTLCGKATSYND